MDITTAALLFAVFMVGIYVNYRRGYREGIYGGHQFGVYETIQWMKENDMISAVHEESGKPADMKLMVAKVLLELEKRRILIAEK